MAWATYMFLAASTAFLSFSLFVRIDASSKNDDDDDGNSNNHHQNSVSVGVAQKQHGEGHPKSSKSSWKDSADVGAVSVMTTNSFKYYFLLQLAWTALAMWSISFAIHGILLKYFYHYSVMVNLSTIIETIFQFSGILILGVFIHSTSWTLVVVLASPQKQPTPTCSMSSFSLMVRPQILVWTLRIGALLIITANILLLVTNTNREKLLPLQQQLHRVGWRIYSISILLFVIHAAMIWYRHAHLVIQANPLYTRSPYWQQHVVL
jgi:hypothetical protein